MSGKAQETNWKYQLCLTCFKLSNMMQTQIEDGLKLHFLNMVPLESLKHVRNFFFKAKILRNKQTGAKVKQTEFKKGF